MSNRNFDDIATQFSLNVKKSGLFNKDGLIKNSLKTTVLDKSIVQKAFYLNGQITSELIEIKGSFYLIGINEIVKKKPLTLNDKIKKNIINKIKKKNIDSKANSLRNKIKEENKIGNIKVFTTRPDTIFGASFIALSVDHKLSKSFENKNDFIKFKNC